MNLQFCLDNCNRMEVVARQLEADYQKIYQHILESVVCEKYGIGGALLHRGFFCPSLIYDIVNRNAKRGHVSDRMPPLKDCEYCFGFNSAGLPIIIRRAENCEFIMYQNQQTIGVEFLDGYGIVGLSECVYDFEGKIESYSLYKFDVEQERIFEIQNESYAYHNESLLVDWSRFNRYISAQPILEHTQFHFGVKNGYLTSYQITTGDVQQPTNSRLFPVKISRNIYDNRLLYGNT